MFKAKFLVVGFICTSIFLSHPLQAAKKKPNPNAPIKVINVVGNTKKTTPKSYVKRKQMVSSMQATLKRGKATLKKARSDLSAVAKSEKRNRKDRLKAKAKKDKALLAMEANNNRKNQAAYAKALKAYLPIKERHESSLKVLNSQQARVAKIESFQRQALNAKRQAKRLTPRQGAPAAINRSPHFVRPRSAYDRVNPLSQVSASQLPDVPTNQPRRYQGQLSPFAQALNDNRYRPLMQNTGNSQGDNYINMPGAPAFNY